MTYRADIIIDYLSKLSGIKWICVREDDELKLHGSPRSIKCSACSLDLKLAFDRCPSCLSIIPFTCNQCPFCGHELLVKKCPKCGTAIYSDGSKAPLFFKRSYAKFRRIEI